MQTAKIEPSELSQLQKVKSHVFYPTELYFLKQHNGYRPGKLHMVLGVTGGGKSTLRNTMLKDFMLQNPDKKVGMYLSEESVENFQADSLTWSSGVDLGSVNLFSQIDHSFYQSDFNRWLDELYDLFIKLNADIYFIDNITTMKFYTGNQPAVQDAMAERIKQMAKELNAPIIIYSHTAKGITKNYHRFVEATDIRGSGGIVNLVEFMYVMQTYSQTTPERTKKITTLRIEKHRGMPVENSLFMLKYQKESEIYLNSFAISISQVKELHKQMDTLK